MRSIAVILAACLLNGALALPTPEIEITDPVLLNREIKTDGSADWSTRVVGGSTASTGQFPYIASLRRSSNSHFCGAAIVSSLYLLSAAHCVVGTSASSVTAVVGTNTLNSGGTRYSINRIVAHSGYNSATVANDISLLRTSSSISGSSLVASIPIGSSTVGAGVSVVLSGWGTLTNGGSLPNNLQYLDLVTISNTECAQSQSPIFSTSLCTFTRYGQGACHGDSGGPLAANGVLVGLVSWGEPCGVGYPDIFTRVSSYISWIQSNAT